jgi:NAD(P)-dependent dehydrogenase (short-subunit alcohol dehydrogenase family)
VAVVTGAGSGIGRAVAERLAEEGARVVCADVQAEAVQDVAKRIRERGAEAEAVPCDVAEPSSAPALIGASLERFGAIHVLCNIAGILRFGHTHEFSLEHWNRILAVNLTGTFLLCREAIPHLLRTRGTIVNMASTAAMAGSPWTAAYSASKGGVLALTYSLAVEYGSRGSARTRCVRAGSRRRSTKPSRCRRARTGSSSTASCRSTGCAAPSTWRAPSHTWPPTRPST